MEQKTSHLMVSPKIIIVILLAAAVIIVSGVMLFRSALSGNVLESIESGDFRFDLCGDGSLSQIRVYKNGQKTATLKVSSVGNAKDHYGVTVTDLSFDGYPDLLVVRKVTEQNVYCDAWIWNHATGTLRAAEALAEVRNPDVNEEYGVIVSYYRVRRDAHQDANGSYYEDAEIISLFTAVDGEIVEFQRYEFVHYTRSDIYAYLVHRFDVDSGSLSSFSEDAWLSPEEAEGFDLKAHVESDMAQHRTDYPNATEE